MISEAKARAAKRGAAVNSAIFAERRITAMRAMILQLRTRGPLGASALAPHIGLHVSTVRYYLNIMAEYGVVKPNIKGPCVVSYALNDAPEKIESLFKDEGEKTALAPVREEKPEDPFDTKDIVPVCRRTGVKAVQVGMVRPDYIACLFGQPQHAQRGAA